MCSAEEEPVLGHPSTAFRSTSGRRECSAQLCGELQLVLPLNRGCGSHLPVHPGTIFGGMRLSGTFLFAWWKWNWREVSPSGRMWKLGAGKAVASVRALSSPTPHTREQTFHRLLGMYPGVPIPDQLSKQPLERQMRWSAIFPWSSNAFHHKKDISNLCSGAGSV